MFREGQEEFDRARVSEGTNADTSNVRDGGETMLHGELSRRCFLARVVAASSLGVASLGGGPALLRSFSVAAQGVRGGLLRATLGAEPETLDPHTGGTLFDIDISVALFDALTYNDTVTGLQGALAESWQSPDALVWTFRLRRNVKFHNGDPVNSAAVRASVERIENKTLGVNHSYTVVIDQVASIETPDPLTIVFRLKQPNASFPLSMADIMIIPHSFDPAKPVGAGPFRFTEWVRDRYVRVRRFEGYYRRGIPYLDEIAFLPTPDENQKVVLLQTGQVDFIDTIPLPRAQEVQKAGKSQVFAVPPGIAPSAYVMMTNTRRPPLNNSKVRQAMNYAVDRRALLDATFGFGAIKSNPIPPKHWAFDPTAASYNTRDVVKAKQLLQEAGVPGGFSVQLKHVTSRAEFTTIAQLFQANMADIGIKVNIVPLELGVFVDQVEAKLVPIQLDGAESVQRAGGAARPPVAPREVPANAPASDQMGGIVRPGHGEPPHRPEVGLDEIQPTRVRRLGDDGDPMRPVERAQEWMPMGVEVVHDHVQALAPRIAGPQPPESGHHIPGRLPASAGAHQAVPVHVVKAQELLGPLRAAVGGPLAPGLPRPRQADARHGAQLQRPPLVETDHRSAPRPLLVEAEDARFFASNAGSGDAFHVLSRWGVTPSRRSTRRTHSSVIGGKRPRCLQYAVSLAVDHSVKGSPRSAGRLSATLTSSRTCGPRRIGSRPHGLVARSNVSKPEVLKRWSHRCTVFRLQPTRSAISAPVRPRVASPTIRYR